MEQTSESFTSTSSSSSKLPIIASSSARSNQRKQFSSFVLFVSVVILVNLCPFQSDFDRPEPTTVDNTRETTSDVLIGETAAKRNDHQPNLDIMASLGSFEYSKLNYLAHVETCLEFVKLMFKNPIRLGKRTTRFTLAEARILGKMAKVWYIKKKVKKLSKKLKKHTIAVPVFTAIPIYEHSYYPQPHVTHVTHGGGMHHAASSYTPVLAHIGPTTGGSTGGSTSSGALTAAASSHQQQLATSASNNHQVASYRMAPGGPQSHHPHHNMYHHPGPMHAGAGQIINNYAPSPPLYVDEAGGLYGHYGNAYGRYDGGYQLW